VIDPEAGASSESSVRTFHVSSALPLSFSQLESYSAVGMPALDWLWEGFNVSITAYGQSGTGKSFSLFQCVGMQPHEQDGILPNLLYDLYERISTSPTPHTYSVGISYWDIEDDKIVDLLEKAETAVRDIQSTRHAPSSELARRNGAFTTVHAPSYEHALRVLQSARAYSSNWNQGVVGENLGLLPNKAHAFVRLSLFDARLKRISTAHIIDLVGHQRMKDPGYQSIQAEAALSRHREKSRINQSLVSTAKLLSLLAKSSTNSKNKNLSNVPARDCRLTEMLAPLIAENCKSFFLCTLSPVAADYADTTTILRTVTQIARIRVPCMKVMNVEEVELAFLPVEYLLAIDSAAQSAGHHRMGQQAHAHTIPGMPSSKYLAVSDSQAVRKESVRPTRPYHQPTTMAPPEQASSPFSDHLGGLEPSSLNVSEEEEEEEGNDQDQILARHSSHQNGNGKETQKVPPSPLEQLAAMEWHTGGSHDTNEEVGAMENSNSAYLRYEGSTSSDKEETHDASFDLEFENLQAGLLRRARERGMTVAEPVMVTYAEEQNSTRTVSPNKARRQLFEEGEQFAHVDLPEEGESRVQRVRPEVSRSSISNDTETTSSALEQIETPDKLTWEEYDRLRRNYGTLLSILKRTEVLKEQQRDKISSLELLMQENTTTLEVQVEDLKAETVSLRSRIRQLESSSMMEDVFRLYERDVEKLRQDYKSMAEENRILQDRLRARAVGDTSIRTSPVRSPLGKVNAGLKATKAQVTHARKTQEELEAVKEELHNLKKKERQFNVSKRCFDDASRRLATVQKELAMKEGKLVEEHMERTMLQTREGKLVTGMESLRSENSHLKKLLQETEEELMRSKQDIVKLEGTAMKEKMLAKASGRAKDVTKRGMEERHSSVGACEDLLGKIERNMQPDNKTGALLSRLRFELRKVEDERKTVAQHEHQLLDMMLEQKAQHDVDPRKLEIVRKQQSAGHKK
jgi:hypothetical protein